MSGACGGPDPARVPTAACLPPASPCCPGTAAQQSHADHPCQWFAQMLPNCLAYAKQAKAGGRPIVGILCEYTPREVIMAAGGVPVCLCGGSAGTIPDAERHLPANLCPLIKSTYGYHVQRSNPFLEMADLIVAETTCDGKKKMYELMGQTRPMYLLELPQKPEDPDALDHWRREVRKLKEHLESRFGTTITDRRLRQAVAVMNHERSLRRQSAELMEADPPPTTGRQLLDFRSSISGIPADLEQYEKAISLLRARRGDPNLAGRVRVLMTGVPVPHGAERVVDIVENSGGVIVCMDNCTGLKPILEDVDPTAIDPLQAIADTYFHLPCSVMTPNNRRLEVIRQLADRYRPHCVIELVWQACLTYDVEACRVRQLAEAGLNLPYLKIETDYSPSDSTRISTRVEALFETVRSRAGTDRPAGKTCTRP
jgi:benzoyl-CoA reductase/2-hydroxyglutaryl-CoA dehydratase subunit BcrC/BadD/HgdB